MTLGKYVLDANIFITPFRQYYPFDIAERFWGQMEDRLKLENVILLDVVRNELRKKEDKLAAWLDGIEGLQVTTVQTQGIIQRYGDVMNFLQESPNYTDVAFRGWASDGIADGWIVATAMEMGAMIITAETGAGPISIKNPSKNAKIPDVAKHFGVQCEDLFYFMRKMNIKL